MDSTDQSLKKESTTSINEIAPEPKSEESVKKVPAPSRSNVGNSSPRQASQRTTTHPTAFTTHLEPQSSKVGTYVSIGAIVVLIILLIFQIISKNNISAQLRQANKDNDALSARVAELETQISASTTNTTQSSSDSSTQPINDSSNSLWSATPGSSTQNFYTVRYHNNVRQQIGQFLLIGSDTNIDLVYLRGNGGTGENAELAIFNIDDPNLLTESTRPLATKLFDASKVPSDGQQFALKLDKPIKLEGGKRYLFAIRPSNSSAQVSIGFTQSDTIGGSAWIHSIARDSVGNALSDKPAWHHLPSADMQISVGSNN
jgi:hypothetical protein